MAELNYDQRKRLRRLAEDARDACNRHYGPFVDAIAHPLNILALLDMAQAVGERDALPSEAASALTNATKALQRALAALA